MSAAEGQERTMRKQVLVSRNKSAKNKLAPYLKRRWRKAYDDDWCRYS
jgi:hypothetical protein